MVTSGNYNIPSNNRELQPQNREIHQFTIITYQVITGNYSLEYFPLYLCTIITYQVITGNYSVTAEKKRKILIITYQVITGNYSQNVI